MVTRAVMAAQRKALGKLSNASRTAAERYFKTLDWEGDPEGSRDKLVAFYESLGTKMGESGSRIGAEFYNDVRSASTAKGRYTAYSNRGISNADIDQMVRANLGPVFEGNPMDALPRLLQEAEQLVMRPYRDALNKALENDPAHPRYARVPAGETCAWCSMLAGNGWTWPSEAEAEMVEYHDNCQCIPVPAFDEKGKQVAGYDYKHYEGLYNDAVEALGAEAYADDGTLDKSAILSQMRSDGNVSDAHVSAP